MPVNPDIIFILLYFQKKVYRQSGASRKGCFFGCSAAMDSGTLVCYLEE